MKPKAPLPEVLALIEQGDVQRYTKDLTFIASGPRARGDAQLNATRDLCAQRLESLGFTVERHAFSQAGVNAIGTLKGTSRPDEVVLISAHIDSVPGCAGGDDNATGVAGVLESARLLASQPNERTLVVACWDEEEVGLVGSRAFARRARSQKQKIEVAFVFDMIGIKNSDPNSQAMPPGSEMLARIFPAEWKSMASNEFRADFVAVLADTGADDHAEAIRRYSTALDLNTLKLVIPSLLKKSNLMAELRRSDHAGFWDQGYPAILMSDTGELRTGRYHCAHEPDDLSGLDHDFAMQIVGAMTGAAFEALNPPAKSRP